MRPLVTFDADVLGRGRTGEESYVGALLHGLAARPDLPFDVRAYVRDPGAEAVRAVVGGRVEAAALPVRSNHVRLGVALPARLRRDRPALHHGNYVLPPLLPCPAVVTVYDASWLRAAETMPVADRVAFRLAVPSAVRRARAVVTISEHARADLVDALPGLDAARVTVVRPPLRPGLGPRAGAEERARAALGLDGQYVLFLGAVQPRKNLARLLEAWAHVRLAGARREVLVIAGREKQEGAAYRALAERLGIAGAVVWAGHVEDGAPLLDLVAGARVLAFPSLYEGWGLPVVEAMACGTPVVTSTTTSLPEAAGGAAVLVDPLSPGAIAAGIRQVLDDPREADRLRAAGLARAAALAAEDPVERLVELYRELLGV